MHKKAVSPLIAIVLLIVFTVAISTLIVAWMYDYTKKTTDAASSGTTGPKGITYCANSNIEISNVNLRNQQIAANTSVSSGTVNYFDVSNIVGTPTITFTGRGGSSSAEGLVGWWHFDEASGASCTDSSGIGNTGTMQGGMSTTVDNDLSSGRISAGKFSNALVFDSVDDYVSVPDTASLDITDAITIEAWVNPLGNGPILPTGWQYMRSVTLSPATPEADYPVKLELNTSNFDYSHAKNDGEDIRFYDTDGNSLNYWTTKWNTTGNSTVWVKVADSGTSKIYMHYGNPGAESESDFSQVFSWSFETVDVSTGVGEYPSMALDSNNYPHISYFDRDTWDLKYAKWNGGAWEIEVVDFVGSVGKTSSIAIDSDDYPHISYHDQTNQKVKYAKWNGAGWEIKDVEVIGTITEISIAVDSNKYAHIIYVIAGGLKYAKWNGGAWEIDDVFPAAGGISMNKRSLALDSSNFPRIAFGDNIPRLKYAAWNGTAWETETVDSNQVGYSPSLALNSSDSPHIAYNQGVASYARWNGTGWEREDVASAGGNVHTIAVDSNDLPHIGYVGDVLWDLKYTKWNGTAWNMESIDSAPDGCDFPSMAVDSNDLPHIGYFCYTDGYTLQVLRYAYQHRYAASEPIATIGKETITGISKAGSYGINANTTIAFATVNNKTITAAISSGWNHITLTYNKNAGGTEEIKLYVNGTLEATGDYSTAIDTNSNNLFIGDLFNGSIDEVRIYDNALTAAEIAETYNTATLGGGTTTNPKASFNGNPSINYTGTLANGDTATIDVGSENFTVGENNITIYTDSGAVDYSVSMLGLSALISNTGMNNVTVKQVVAFRDDGTYCVLKNDTTTFDVGGMFAVSGCGMECSEFLALKAFTDCTGVQGIFSGIPSGC